MVTRLLCGEEKGKIKCCECPIEIESACTSQIKYLKHFCLIIPTNKNKYNWKDDIESGKSLFCSARSRGNHNGTCLTNYLSKRLSSTARKNIIMQFMDYLVKIFRKSESITSPRIDWRESEWQVEKHSIWFGRREFSSLYGACRQQLLVSSLKFHLISIWIPQTLKEIPISDRVKVLRN